MVPHKSRRHSTSSLPGLYPGDRRDRRPGTHFAAELGAPSRAKHKPLPPETDPHVDEDLGISQFGIDLPFVKC
jgi:hypothetical protein